MLTHIGRAAAYFLLVLLVINLSGCSLISQVLPTVTPAPTQTPLPTATPMPSPTFTPEPTATQPPATPTAVPLPPTAEATLSADQAILVYYINKNESGPYGCGEALWYIKTKQPKTSNAVNDIRYALNTILTYHSETIGSLYNPGYASNLAVSNVTFLENGVIVSLTGTYTRTKDNCDGKRLIDQLRMTIKQFEGISNIQITINGTPIADVISRK